MNEGSISRPGLPQATAVGTGAPAFGGLVLGQQCAHAVVSGGTQPDISGITVTNGSIQIGASSNADAGQWINVDDLSPVRSGRPGVEAFRRIRQPFVYFLFLCTHID